MLYYHADCPAAIGFTSADENKHLVLLEVSYLAWISAALLPLDFRVAAAAAAAAAAGDGVTLAHLHVEAYLAC